MVAAAATVLAVVRLRPAGTGLLAASALAIPPSLLLALATLGARFPVAALPLRRARPLQIAIAHLASAAVVGALWVAAWDSWIDIAARILELEVRGDLRSLGWTGGLLYLAAVVIFYLAAEMAATNEAREAALRYQVLAREAELAAYKAQIDPHFLFNSLNAIASLCGSRPLEARAMAQRLADFFRLSVRLGRRDRITLAEELDLARSYLDIERIRFGERLGAEVSLDPAVENAAVPPLLLQPLVENAVRHGIATMVAGGAIRVVAAKEGARVRVVVDNPRDPDATRAAGEGVGLANVRARLASFYDGSAVIRTSEGEERFRVEIEIPASASGGAA